MLAHVCLPSNPQGDGIARSSALLLAGNDRTIHFQFEVKAMTPEDRQAVFSHREIAAVIKGITLDDGTDAPITGKSLGEAILFVSEEASTNASSAHVIYGANESLSYTDCLSIYRDYGPALRRGTN
ncbi:hypothetical protein ACIQUB_02335 [Rhizobium sp. NPDC090275]|uniref:hypothetical protein n=1 Tax=Rhizobium sp. NPDC090275 TaxID=3364498 RepID=UPI00383AE7BE